jgi:hypothetical protein
VGLFKLLCVHDRFRLGGTNRKLRRVFKVPAVWSEVEFQGHGFLSTLFWRVFRIGHLGLQHVTVLTAELNDPALGLMVADAERYTFPNLHTITLNGPGYRTHMSKRESRATHQRIMATLTKAKLHCPRLTRVELKTALMVTEETLHTGFIERLAALHKSGLTVTMPRVIITMWPRTDAERCALTTVVEAQECITHVQVEANSEAPEDLPLLRTITSKGMTDVRLALYEQVQRTMSQEFSDACFEGAVLSLRNAFVHGVSVVGVQLPSTSRLVSLTLSKCTVSDKFCASLPATLTSLGLPQTSVTTPQSLNNFLSTTGVRLLYLNIANVFLGGRENLHAVLLAAAQSPSLRRVNANHMYLYSTSFPIIEQLCSRDIVVEAQREFLLHTPPDLGPCFRIHG